MLIKNQIFCATDFSFIFVLTVFILNYSALHFQCHRIKHESGAPSPLWELCTFNFWNEPLIPDFAKTFSQTLFSHFWVEVATIGMRNGSNWALFYNFPIKRLTVEIWDPKKLLWDDLNKNENSKKNLSRVDNLWW